MTPALAPLLVSQLEASAFAGPWPHGILFVVLMCAGVDFIKVLVELLGRSEERVFTSDPSLVSVVIPCRNGAQQLRATVADVAKIIPPERILVVDDASTDCTSTTAATLGCQVHRFEKKKGNR